MGTQISFWDGNNKFVNDKPIRLIELFAGIGSQAKALKNLEIPFEHYRKSVALALFSLIVHFCAPFFGLLYIGAQKMQMGFKKTQKNLKKLKKLSS